MALAAGSRLGPYEILSVLGAGGMGEVYRARDTKLNRDVAIKVLLPAVANDPDRLARFSREAQVLASLNHPNIAHIYGVEEADGVTALVMELVEGEDLSQRIARGAIPIDEALPIARQIAEALEAAHDHGIIHRDLKPANIKVRADGTVKVLDFGLAKAIDPNAASNVSAMNSPTLSIHATQAGIILGTAAYMSPEQARGRVVDRRTDIWAFGCVLFEMLTGKRAFQGDDATDTIVAVIGKDPDWTSLPAALSPNVQRVLRRSLEKDPKRRLDSSAVVRIELDDVAKPADPIANVKRTVAWLPWGVAAALALGLLASVIYPAPVAEDADVVRFMVEPPSGSMRRERTGFAVSPNGRMLAFLAHGSDGINRIMTRRLDDPETLPVNGTERARAPFWSPDSRSIGFLKDGAVFRVDLDGRAPVRICDVPGGIRTASSGTWGVSGIIVFAAGAGLFQVAESGGAPTALAQLDTGSGEIVHTAPFFLPDGKRLLFLALPSAQTRGVIWATSIDNPARTRVGDSSGGAVYQNGWLLTTTESPRNLVAQRFDPERLSVSGSAQPVRDRLGAGSTGGEAGFSSSSQGVLVVEHPNTAIHQLTWMNRAGQVLSTIGPAADIREFSLAPDGRRAAASVIDGVSSLADLWMYENGREAGTRLTFQSTSRRPMWAPDGRRIYFTSNPGFSMRSLVIGAATAQPFENPGGLIFFEDATRDGRHFVLKAGTPPPGPTIYLQQVGAPEQRRVLVEDQFAANQARVSPDGRWLAFTISRPAGPEVFIQPFDRPGDRVQVSKSGGFGAVWREDGGELYYEHPEGLMAVTVTEREGALTLSDPQKLFALRTQGVTTNQPHNVAVASNGQKFLVNTIIGDSDNAPLEVTLNWTAGLKK
jgi:serine/threonine protein kinase/Tol biopolymer transport system component